MSEQATIHAVSPQRHGAKRWLAFTNYAFAAQDAVCPLVVAEIPKAMMALPIGFVKDEGGNFLPVAIQGLQNGQNLLVGPDGRWFAAYSPAQYRGYPFFFANTEEGKKVLCVNEASGLVTDGAEGEPFFDEEGELGEKLKAVLGFLNHVEESRTATAEACKLLDSHGLIQPWDISFKLGEEVKKVEGLFSIDEKQLKSLPGEVYVELREAALPMAYCQLLSMQHINSLVRLASDKASLAQATLPEELDLEFLNDSGSLNFNNL